MLARFGLGRFGDDRARHHARGARHGDLVLGRDRPAVESGAGGARNGAMPAVDVAIAIEEMVEEMRSRAEAHHAQ